MTEGLDKIEIENHIEKLFYGVIDKYNTTNTGERIDTFHVSEFTQECLRQSYYRRTQPKVEFDQERERVLWTGNIIHEHTSLDTINELTMCYDIERDIALPPAIVKNMTPEESINIVTGTLDDLVFYKGHYIIADKKTWNGRGYVKNTPNPEYVKQLNIYRVLLWETWKIDARIGCLLFLDKTENLRPQPIAFELDPISVTKEYLKKTLVTLKQPDGPEAKVCYLCSGQNASNRFYCPYTKICSEQTDRESQLIKIRNPTL